MSVLSRTRMVQVIVDASLKTVGKLLPAVYEMMDNGLWHQDQFPDNKVFAEGVTQEYVGTIKAFMPSELRAIFDKTNMRILRLGALSSLSNTFVKKVIEQIFKDEVLLKALIDLADRFDKEIQPEGAGARNRCGLIAVAEPKS